MDSRLLYGLANASLDETIENEIREDNPNMSDTGIQQEVNRIKKQMTLFNEHNTKSKSTKKPTGVTYGK